MMFPLPVRMKRMNRSRVSAHGAIFPMSLALAQTNRAITRITPTLLVWRITMGIADTDQSLSARYHDHDLSSKRADYSECHIDPNLLLIYRKLDAYTLRLARLGSHSELFG